MSVNAKGRNYSFANVFLFCFPVGRIVFQLFSDTSPKTSKNFLSLCTGEYLKSSECFIKFCLFQHSVLCINFVSESFYRIYPQFENSCTQFDWFLLYNQRPSGYTGCLWTYYTTIIFLVWIWSVLCYISLLFLYNPSCVLYKMIPVSNRGMESGPKKNAIPCFTPLFVI